MEKRRRLALSELNRLSSLLKGKIVEDNEVYKLEFDSSIGEGGIKCINFDNGLFAFEFKATLYKDIEIVLSASTNTSIFFLYCFQGNCFYSVKPNGHLVKLDELQTAVIKSNPNFSGGLVMGKGSDQLINLIRVDIESYFAEKPGNRVLILDELKSFLSELDKKDSLVHLGKLNLEIGEYIKKLSKAKYAYTLSELLYFEGICVLILASHIEQYKRETKGTVNSTKLIRREMQTVMKIAEAIRLNPEEQFTVQLLCEKSGLSAAKLQEGFKFLYKRTVSDFIRNSRLEKAEVLIRETDMNISEVVYAIGLTSRSYFCKIFKEKYKCNPKRYKSRLNIQMVS